MSRETWYRVTTYDNDIEPLVVISATEKTVTYEYMDWGRKPCQARERKDSPSRKWFPTWAAAHEWKMEQLQKRLDSYTRLAEIVQDNIRKVSAMQEPK